MCCFFFKQKTAYEMRISDWSSDVCALPVFAGVAPHLGRGGWTWYTGAAAWTWRLAVEEILGVRLIQNELQIRPSLPRDWDRAEMTFRRGAATIAVTLQVDHDLDQEARIFVDGADWHAPGVPFPEDGATRNVLVRLARPA